MPCVAGQYERRERDRFNPYTQQGCKGFYVNDAAQ